MSEFASNFGMLDWVIVAAYLLGTVAIGLYANRYIQDMADYVVASRSLNSCVAVATMLGSEIGLVTVMYTAQKGFTGGFAAFHIGVIVGASLFVGRADGVHRRAAQADWCDDHSGILRTAIRTRSPHSRRHAAVGGRHSEHGRVSQSGRPIRHVADRHDRSRRWSIW